MQRQEQADTLKILQKSLSKELFVISEKVKTGIPLSTSDGILLFEKGELGFLGILADVVRKRKNGDKAWFIRNFHIEPTNICVNRCNFCSFSHHFSASKWELSVDEILAKVDSQDESVREIHITGAVHPKRDIVYYGELIKKIKARRPKLHVKAYSAVELDYMIKKAGLDFITGLQYLKDCGLDSVPGGGAEIFDETIREKICGMKTCSADWLAIHRAAHILGLPSNATMLYGHLETFSHRVDHLERLRQLQNETGGFNAFIPLKFHRYNNEMKDVLEVPVIEDMRMYAISRVYLDNFPHMKAYWPALGRKMAQVSLSFGVDDMDGTINDSTRIYSLAGAEEQSPVMTVSGMKQLIEEAGRIPVERDSYYRPVL
ncbi:MAG: CofH family radical SAM protein [Bacteroidetes bacterium]|nr:CofH family radical SAM protein [Bacteroidota bacterium]